MVFFFFNDTATTEIYTLSLHDALPILTAPSEALGGLVALSGLNELEPGVWAVKAAVSYPALARALSLVEGGLRSEEHTSELQSQSNLVCRLLLEKTTNG